MPTPPIFQYFLGVPTVPVLPGSNIWHSSLPVDRHHFQRRASSKTALPHLTHGDYFELTQQFLQQEGGRLLSAAVAGTISVVRIHLMKHGRFYHPSRIEAVSGSRTRQFVLNVATSAPGRAVIADEVRALKRLGALSGPTPLPHVHGDTSVQHRNGKTAAMFLGEWFSGYQEFHLARDPDKNRLLPVVWEEDGACRPMSAPAVYALYHEASRILSAYYDVDTTSHIFPWHHGAGDFVVKLAPTRLSVRLITVRGVVPLVRSGPSPLPETGDQAPMEALLLFLIVLSLRMRLDREAGIGDIVWADASTVPGVWTGFLKGLLENRYCATPRVLTSRFRDFLAAKSPADLLTAATAAITTFPPHSRERQLAKKHLAAHTALLCDTITRIGFPD